MTTEAERLLREVLRRIKQIAGLTSDDWRWYRDHGQQTLRAFASKLSSEIEDYLAHPEPGLPIVRHQRCEKNCQLAVETVKATMKPEPSAEEVRVPARWNATLIFDHETRVVSGTFDLSTVGRKEKT